MSDRVPHCAYDSAKVGGLSRLMLSDKGVFLKCRLGLLLLVAIMLIGCGGGSTNEQGEFAGTYPIKAVVTVGMVADLVREVGGEHVAVESLIGEGVDPHQHTATRSDSKRLIEADIIFYNGLLLEGRMTDTFEQLVKEGKPVFAVCDGIDQDSLNFPDEFQGHADPHVWMDVTLWQQALATVEEALCNYDPAHEADYHANAQSFLAELKKLDEYVRASIESIPQEQRLLITAHDAFGYFGESYKIEVMAPQGISTETEASVDDINRLVDVIVKRKVGAIFIESSVNQRSIEAIIEGAKQRGQEVQIGGTLFSDAMGKPGTYEGTYIGMIDHNATIICRSLGGIAPEEGMQGKLGAK